MCLNLFVVQMSIRTLLKYFYNSVSFKGIVFLNGQKLFFWMVRKSIFHKFANFKAIRLILLYVVRNTDSYKVSEENFRMREFEISYSAHNKQICFPFFLFNNKIFGTFVHVFLRKLDNWTPNILTTPCFIF